MDVRCHPFLASLCGLVSAIIHRCSLVSVAFCSRIAAGSSSVRSEATVTVSDGP